MNQKTQNNSRGFLFRGAPLLLLLVVFGVGYFLIQGVLSLSSKDPAPADTGTAPALTDEAHLASDTRASDTAESQAPDTQAPDTHAPDTQAPDTTASTQAPTEPPVSTEAPTEPPVTTEKPTEPPTEAPTEPAGPEMTEVDESYFEDALFIGDSRTDGLCLYCPVGHAKHYSGTSMTIFKIMDTTDEAYGYYGVRGLLQGMQFGKIYIMFGINEAGYDTDAFANKYRSVIEEIRSYQPNALIYIQSILYVTQKHEANNPVFASSGLKEKNAKLKEIANGKDIFYLEVNDALNDGTDHLPSDYTGDGVHLKASYYHLWKEYLLAHAVVDAAHPWTARSTED